MKPPDSKAYDLRALWSVPIYLALIAAYVLFALPRLGGPLKDLRDFAAFGYAVTCVVLTVAQAVVLEALASWLAALCIRRRRRQ